MTFCDDVEMDSLVAGVSGILGLDAAYSIDHYERLPGATTEAAGTDQVSRPMWRYLATLDLDGGGSASFFIEEDTELTDVVEHALDQLTNDLSETREYWGQAFPRCPGHVHPAAYTVHDMDRDVVVTLTCPTSGAEVSRTEVVL